MQPLSQLVQQTTTRALERGAILPMQIETLAVNEGDLNYTISHISSLSLKDMAGALQKSAGGNPFLPYEQDLYVADLSPTHVLLLNKFPIVNGHVMAITREFVPQLSPFDDNDFAALAALLRGLDGLVMYNGGQLGGASQPHKHLHMMPGRKAPLESIFPLTAAVGTLQQIPQFNFVHAFIRLDEAIVDSEQSAEYLRQLFNTARAHCDLNTNNGEMPPFNLLATKRWMLIVPRSAGTWSNGEITVMVSALDFGGQLSVRGADQIDVVRKVGLRKILEATTVAI